MAEQEEHARQDIEMPAPTVWPMVAALGVTLLFAGLVTSAIVSAVGLGLGVLGAVGWWRDVLPTERVELLPLRPQAQRAAAVLPAAHSVEHLVVGRGHRVRLPVEAHPYSSGLKGGVVGAVAMAIVAELYGLMAFGSLWYPVNLLAAAAVPSLAAAGNEQLARFSAIGLGVAAIMHAVISLFVGLLYAVILPMLPRFAALWGGVLAPLLWSGLVWASLGLINPALNARISWPWFIASQVVFGLTAGFVVARSERIETLQTWPLAVRAGVEAPGVPPRVEREE